jgi:intraflagellar transport protein 56
MFILTNKKTFSKGPKSALQTRVLFHISHKQNNDEKFQSLHRQLQNTVEDQMCLASMHYMKSHYQEALDVYKRYLVENRYLSLPFFFVFRIPYFIY